MADRADLQLKHVLYVTVQAVFNLAVQVRSRPRHILLHDRRRRQLAAVARQAAGCCMGRIAVKLDGQLRRPQPQV